MVLEAKNAKAGHFKGKWNQSGIVPGGDIDMFRNAFRIHLQGVIASNSQGRLKFPIALAVRIELYGGLHAVQYPWLPLDFGTFGVEDQLKAQAYAEDGYFAPGIFVEFSGFRIVFWPSGPWRKNKCVNL